MKDMAVSALNPCLRGGSAPCPLAPLSPGFLGCMEDLGKHKHSALVPAEAWNVSL